MAKILSDLNNTIIAGFVLAVVLIVILLNLSLLAHLSGFFFVACELT